MGQMVLKSRWGLRADGLKSREGLKSRWGLRADGA